MEVRKNAKFLTPAERENFVKACVLMKADIVNPGAPPAQQYCRWDENVAIHNEIQNAFAPGAAVGQLRSRRAGAYASSVGTASSSVEIEKQLQSYVPGVMMPYWDWTDPTSIMTDTFLGPNGSGGSSDRQCRVLRTGGARHGWKSNARSALVARRPDRMEPAVGVRHAERVRFDAAISPSPHCRVRPTSSRRWAKTTYAAFQNAVESGAGLASGNQMHNGMHGWIGGPGQMSYPAYSPFDPFFYLHHCNIDRIWAMWQADGHADEYPPSGGHAYHNRNDIMYPVGRHRPGFGTNVPVAGVDPDAGRVRGRHQAKRRHPRPPWRLRLHLRHARRHRHRPGPNRQHDRADAGPDEYVGSTGHQVGRRQARDIGVPGQDCETVQQSGLTYVIAGVKTFRHLGGGNDFTPVFTGPGLRPGQARLQLQSGDLRRRLRRDDSRRRYAIGRRVGRRPRHPHRAPVRWRPGGRAALSRDADRRTVQRGRGPFARFPITASPGPRCSGWASAPERTSTTPPSPR